MGCFSSKQAKSYDLGNHSYRESSPYEQMEEETPLSEQNLKLFGDDSIEYADHGHSSDIDDDFHSRGWNDNEDRYQDTSWREGRRNSESYDNREDF